MVTEISPTSAVHHSKVSGNCLATLATLVGVRIYTWSNTVAGLGRLYIGCGRFERFAGDDAIDIYITISQKKNCEGNR